MFDLDGMKAWDAGLDRLERARPAALRALFAEVMAFGASASPPAPLPRGEGGGTARPAPPLSLGRGDGGEVLSGVHA
jgi:hypothetical protein